MLLGKTRRIKNSLPLLALLISFAGLTQESLTSGPGNAGEANQFREPSAEDVTQAQARIREAMGQAPQTRAPNAPLNGTQKTVTFSFPNVAAIPKPAVKQSNVDLAKLAEQYKGAVKSNEAAQKATMPELMVMVSLSMPKASMDRVLDQAERAGATLVFRGLKGDSMTKMGEEMTAIIGQRKVAAVIHPPAFQQFSVTTVPAVVLARQEASGVLDDGCSRPDSFVKVTGDVSLEYALDYIERRNKVWAGIAKYYRTKIVGSIN